MSSFWYFSPRTTFERILHKETYTRLFRKTRQYFVFIDVHSKSFKIGNM